MDKQIKQPKVSGRERVYNFIKDYIRENSYPPSIREICAGAKLKSTCSVYNHLHKLEDEGKIIMKPNSLRAIKLVGYELVEVEEVS